MVGRLVFVCTSIRYICGVLKHKFSSVTYRTHLNDGSWIAPSIAAPAKSYKTQIQCYILSRNVSETTKCSYHCLEGRKETKKGKFRLMRTLELGGGQKFKVQAEKQHLGKRQKVTQKQCLLVYKFVVLVSPLVQIKSTGRPKNELVLL